MPAFLVFLFFAAFQPAWSSSPKPFAFGAVRFEANQGQADTAALYFARARGQHVYFMEREIVFDASEGAPVRMSFAGARKARWTPVGEAVDRISYYLGNDPSRWVKEAPVYGRLAWRNVYPGIDAVFYDRGGNVEYDLVLAPGADPSLIRLRFTGASRITTTTAGVIEIKAGQATLRQHAPEIYQQDKQGRRHRVSGRFLAAANGEFRLQLGKYEKSRPLIVDPVLEASTYWGGENDDEITAVSEYFVAGNTRSVGFANTAGARRRTRDIFFTGLGQFGNTRLIGTIILGGSGDDELAGVVLTGNNSPAVYLAGTTNSRDFTTNTFVPPPYLGGASDGFLLELSNVSSFGPPSLGSFRYVGGSGRDRIHAVQPYNFAAGLLAGSTDSPDLDTAPGGQRTLGGGTDAFFGIFQRGIAPTLSYLGGSGDDEAFAIQQDFTTNSIFIAGQTRSADFPQATATLRGPSDAFLTHVRGPSPRLTDAATFQTIATHLIGGSGEDSISALVRLINSPFQFQQPIPRFGVAGTTTSPDLPVRNAAQSALAGDSDAFAGVWVPESSSFQWLTYLGGSAADAATSAALSANGDLSIGGWTHSADLPVVDALQPKTGGAQDGLFALFDDAGAPRQLTYFGGSGDDRIDSVAFLTAGATRVGGYTTSANLPLRNAAQPDYGAKSDGFYADIGTDFLSGPNEIILPKDAARTLTIRPGRNALSPPITFRTSDPSRLRFSLAGRSLSELTSPAEIGVRLEALSDAGEVEITASSAGFATKTIRVKLYPSVLVLRGSSNVSIWSPSASADLALRAIDPATGQFTGDTFNEVRPGVIPTIQWTSSNPSVLEVSRPSAFSPLSVDLIIRGPGQSRISAAVPGWRVVETEPAIITVSRPELFPPSAPVRLGQYLQNPLPIQFAANGLLISSSSIRGTLTARSEDPSRLLLSTSQGIRGSAQVTVAFDQRTPLIYAQALGSSGEVRVLLTSPDFAGELAIPVTLEPSVLRWGTRVIVNGASQFAPELNLSQGSAGFNLAISLEGQSGGFNAGQVPGTPPATLKFSNSDPSVLALSRLTADLTNRRIETRALSPGTSQLSLSVSPDTIGLDYSSITVTVTSGTGISTEPRAPVVGKDLQTGLSLRGVPPGASISLSSSDPTAVLFSANSQTSGTPSLMITASEVGATSVIVQSLKDQGETTVRIRVSGQPDVDVPVTHVASGIVLSAFVTGSGAISELSVSTAPLDELTATPLSAQTLRPGVTAEVRLRTEGSPITLTPSVVFLTNVSSSARISFSPPPPGAETLVTAEAAGFTPSTRRSVRVRGSDAPPAISNLPSAIYLTRDTVRNLDFFSTLEFTATSSDPSKFLLATSRAAAPSASVRVPPGSVSSLFFHALTETGNATVRIEAAGRPIQEVQVAFVPLVLAFDQPQIPVGQSRELFARSGFTLRPGAGPFRFSLRSTDPSIATVSPDSIEWNASAGIPPIRITAVASGRTTITAEGSESVYFTPIEVSVTSPSAPSAPLELYLGRNTQVAYSHSFRDSFPNGAIVTVTSSDPARLLLSRTAASLGTANTTVSVQPGGSNTQPLYLQAQGSEGDVTLRVQNVDGTVQTVILHIVNSWIGCDSNRTSSIGVTAGSSARVACYLRSATPANFSSEGPQLLPGAVPTLLRLRSSDSAVFTVTPESASFTPGQESFEVRAVAPGTATLLVDQPDGFGPAPDAPTVTVTLPTLTTGCSAITLGIDTQRTCEILAPSGVTLTAESSHPDLTLVTNNPTEPGSAQTQLTAPRVTIQQLARYGTAEITVRAAGYADLIIPVVGGETQMRLNQFSSTAPLTNLPVRVGSSIPVTLQLSGVARAGSRIFAAINASPAGIIAIDPASVVFSADQSAVSLNIRGIAPGSAIVSLTAPANISVSATQAVVSVTP